MNRRCDSNGFLEEFEEDSLMCTEDQYNKYCKPDDGDPYNYTDDYFMPVILKYENVRDYDLVFFWAVW